MVPTFSQLIVWVVIGLIGGTLAGYAITWHKGGFGVWRNAALGLVGALVGGFLFRLFGLFPRLDAISFSLRDVVAAFLGSLIVLLALWAWEKFGK